MTFKKLVVVYYKQKQYVQDPAEHSSALGEADCPMGVLRAEILMEESLHVASWYYSRND